MHISSCPAPARNMDISSSSCIEREIYSVSTHTLLQCLETQFQTCRPGYKERLYFKQFVIAMY